MTTWTSSDFKVGEFLGKGKFGVVFKALELYSKKDVALKMMGKQVIRSFKMQKQLKREIEIHSHLKYCSFRYS